MNISIVLNVSCNDLYRIRKHIPLLCEEFEEGIVNEILIIYDATPPSGRIAKLHGFSFYDHQIEAELTKCKDIDRRVKVITLDYSQLNEISTKWFGYEKLNRCQGGTPIFPFFYAIEQAKNDFVIKLDSDILVKNNGLDEYISEKFKASKELSFMSLPRFPKNIGGFSTRAFAINKFALMPILPLKFIRLDALRRLHRLSTHRDPYRAPEDAIQKCIDTQYVQHEWSPLEYGYTLHVSLSWWPGLVEYSDWMDHFLKGEVPTAQTEWDFNIAAWVDGDFQEVKL
jgi:hypothetical protein